MTLLLNNDELKQLITMKDCIEILEDGYREHGFGRVAHRRRSNIIVPTGQGRSYIFANFEGTVVKSGYHAIRLRSEVNEWLDEKGERTVRWAARPGLHCGLVLIFNIMTGELEGILNGDYFEALRVGATSAVAGRYLSREDSSVLGIIGAGHQARSHLEAMCAIRPIKKVKVYSLRAESRQAFARESEKKLGIEVAAVESPEEALRDSDIVSACTSSPRPFVKAEWIGAGLFLSSARPFGEVGQEALGVFDIAVVHERGFGTQFRPALAGQGGQKPPVSAGGKDENDLPSAVTLAELCVDEGKRRTQATQRTYFANNEGHGVQFSMTGAFVLKRARELGVGRELPAEWFLHNL